MFEKDYFTLGRLYGIPIKLHWSLPLGALFFSGFRFVPGFWLGFFGLILIHECGHAFLSRIRGLRVLEIQIHGFGGLCRHERGTPYDTAIIAWGGVLAQFLVLYLPAVALIHAGIWPAAAFGAELAEALTRTNLILIAFNLIPVGPFDGRAAWQLPRMWRLRRELKKEKKPENKAGLRVVQGGKDDPPQWLN